MQKLANTPKELLSQLVGIGLEARTDTGLGHYKIHDPETGAWLFNLSSSPSDVNWYWNIKRHLRRLGLLRHFEDAGGKKEKRGTKGGTIDLVALKRAQDAAAAAGEHVPVLEDLQDSTEFFTRLVVPGTTTDKGSRGFTQLAQEEAIDLMTAKADSPRMHATIQRFKKFMDDNKDKLEAQAKIRNPDLPAGRGSNTEFVRIALEEVGPHRGLRVWSSLATGQQTISTLKNSKNPSLSLWGVNLIEATMDHIDGLQWSEHISNPDPAKAGAAKEAQVDPVEDKKDPTPPADPTPPIPPVEPIKEEKVDPVEDTPVELPVLLSSPIAEKYAAVLLGLLEKYEIPSEENWGFAALLERLDKLAGI